MRRSSRCHTFCNACNHVGYDCADAQRKPLLRFEALLHIAIAALSFIGLLGLFSETLDSVPWAVYRQNPMDDGMAFDDNHSVAVHINIWGGCIYGEGTELCLPWGDLSSNVTAQHVVRSCRKAATSVRVQVILAVVDNLLKTVGVAARCTREGDRNTKCLQLITNLLPLLFMGVGALQFNQSCYRAIESSPNGFDATRGTGFWCFALGVFVNFPCLLIELAIPAPPAARNEPPPLLGPDATATDP